jgi:hypothetical protein
MFIGIGCVKEFLCLNDFEFNAVNFFEIEFTKGDIYIPIMSDYEIIDVHESEVLSYILRAELDYGDFIKFAKKNCGFKSS